ncbi:hypothetical protein ACEE16_10465 [Streptococcus suis]
MVKSYRTMQLENKLQTIREKITDLTDVRRTVSNCKTKVKNSYNEIDSIHVKGTKYSNMYQDEQETISDYSQKLSQKKEKVLSKIDSNLSSLRMLENSTNQSLQLSIMDDVREEQRKAEERRRAARSRS